MANAAVQPADLGQEAADASPVAGATGVAGAVGAAGAKRAGALSPVFGPGSLFVFAACAVGLPYSGLLPFTTIAGAWPGADLIVVLAVALGLAFVHAVTFAAIGSIGRNGESGALLSGRGLNSPLAFASSWTMAVFLALGSGVVLGSILSEVMPVVARSLSILFDNPLLLNYQAALTSQEGIVLYGSFGVLVIFFLLFIPPRLTFRIMLGGLLLTAAAWLVICLQLAFATPQAFHAAWDHVMGEGAFMSLLSEAGKAGLRLDRGMQNMLFAGLAMGMVLLSGYFFPAYFPSEAREPRKHLLRSSLLALLACGALLLAGALLAQRVIPLEFLSAQAVFGKLPQFQTITLTWLPFYAAVLRPDPILFWTVSAGWIAGLLLLAFAMAYTASRMIHGWVEGGFLPEGARFVHPELRSPLIAVLLVSMLVEAGLVALALGMDVRLWLPLAVAGSQIVPVVRLLRLPFAEKALYQASAGWVTRKVGPVPLVQVTGSISLILLITTVVLWVLNPALGGIRSGGALAFGLVFGLGVVWYYGSRPYQTQSAANVT